MLHLKWVNNAFFGPYSKQSRYKIDADQAAALGLVFSVSRVVCSAAQATGVLGFGMSPCTNTWVS